MVVRLLDRMETVKELEQQLAEAKSSLEQEETHSQELWKSIRDRVEKLDQEDRTVSRDFFQVLYT